MRLTNAFVDHPCKILVGNIIILFILAYMSISMDYLQLADDHRRSYSDWNHPAVINDDKVNLMWERIERLEEEKSEEMDEGRRL